MWKDCLQTGPSGSLAGSPFRVPVRQLVDPSKVRCSGPGLGGGVRAHVPQTFTVDSSKAGVAPLEVQLYGPTGEKTSETLRVNVQDVSPVDLHRQAVQSGSVWIFMQ